MLCHHPDKSCGHKHCDSGDMSLICQVTFENTYLKGYVNLWIDAPHHELPPCYVWWTLVQCKWRYKVLNIT